MVLAVKRLLFWAFAVVLILMVPLVAMQFTVEVNWTMLDFVVMGTGLMSIGLVYELIVRKSNQKTYRIAFGVAIAAIFLLFWINGAVGIIGNEGQPANMLYGLVIGVVLIGALLVRFKARGMAITLFTAAAIQMLVPVIALFIWPPDVTSWSPGVLGVFILTAFFAFLLTVSALLFKRASTS
ncbi:hypothetical protein LVD13_05860 [Flavobacteriaceae bacterium D16]|nr:hypothetical protein [Flavobacteriaceae bacterium D16]